MILSLKSNGASGESRVHLNADGTVGQNFSVRQRDVRLRGPYGGRLGTDRTCLSGRCSCRLIVHVNKCFAINGHHWSSVASLGGQNCAL